MYNPNQKSLDDKLLDGSLNQSRSRRGGVSAAVQGAAPSASEARAAFESRLANAGDVTKDAETRAMLYDAIDKSILFSGMTEAQRTMIVDVMVSVRCRSREVIIQQGDVLEGGYGDNFYVVGSGYFHIRRRKESADEADIHPLLHAAANGDTNGEGGAAAAAAATRKGSTGNGVPVGDSPTLSPEVRRIRTSEGELDVSALESAVKAAETGQNGGDDGGAARELAMIRQGQLVQERWPGDAFGELALMYNVARQATVMCMSEYATLYALPRQIYRDVTQLEALDSIESIVETLQSVELLTCLGDDQFTKLIDSFEMVAYKPSQRIIRQGELGNSFYIILKGTVNCISGESVVATLNRCDYFGERALLKEEPRAVHVDAVTAVTLAKITRETFHDILGPLQTLMEQQFTRRVLQRVPILQHLSESERMLVLEKFTETEFVAGDKIVTQGEMGDNMYIVKTGQVDCLVSEKKVREYRTGEYFGERALRLHEPRAATCVAVGTVTCVSLKKVDFETLLGPLQAVLDANMLKDTLRTAPLFRYLTSSERENVLEGFEFTQFNEGELIFRQGDPGVSFVLLRDGVVKLFRDGVEIGEKKAGEHLGEKSLLYGVTREFDAVVTSTTCLCAYLDKEAFESVMGPIADVLKRATDLVKRGDLEEFALLGIGTFGKVRLVRDRVSQRVFAMKIISKARVIQYNQQEHIMSEKSILADVDHPFIIQLVAAFKDDQRLYMVLEYCPGGELFTLLQRQRRLGEAACCFYGGSVMLAFEYLHEISVIYRDLKPENLLLDSQGYVKICDFGFAKRIKDRTFTLCGTPEYLAPEIIRSKGHGKGVDWWALGILLYEMAVGSPPYCGDSAMQTYKLILEGALDFPRGLSDKVKDLVKRLLHQSVTKRLGCLREGATDLRRHAFFAELNVPQLLRMKLPTPYLPKIKDTMDVSNFAHYDDVPDEKYIDDGTGWDDEF